MTSLNKLKVLLIVLLILLTSCSMKVPCDNGNIRLGFISFPDTVTNNFILRQFKKATRFKVLVDTILITKINGYYKQSSDSLQVEYSFNTKHGYTSSKHGLTSEYDYEVYLSMVNRTFQIGDIDEEYRMQKKGIISDSSDCRNYIKGYSVNGQKLTGEFTDLTIYFHY